MAFLAVAAGAARNVKGHRTEIAFFDELDCRTHLYHFTGVFVAHLHAGGSSEAAIIDVQVAAADIRRHEFNNDGVVDLLSFWVRQFWISPVLNLHPVRTHERDGAV